MKELTDLEICTRIAEIEGIKVFMYSHIVFGDILCREMSSLNLAPQPYNPLTDDALCFRLMVKYEVEAIPLVSGVNGRHSAIARVFNGQDDFIEFKAQSDTLNKAICLAIIKAHG